MVLLLSNDDCAKVIDIAKSISLIRDAFESYGRTRESIPSIPRTRLALKSEENPDSNFLFTIIGGTFPESDVIALRYESGIFNSEDKQRVGLSEKSSLIFLYGRSDGKIVSILHGNYISNLRVAATTAVATDLLANAEIHSMGIIGTGKMASLHLQALMQVRTADMVLAYSSNSIHLRRFCHEMKKRFGLIVKPSPTSHGVVSESQLVTVATNSRKPVFDGKSLNNGTHVNCILSPDQIFSGQDVDNQTYQRANLIVVNSINQAYLDGQNHLLKILTRKGRAKIFELTDIVGGRVVVRRNDDDITLYDNNAGMGVQFAAICEYVLKRAKKKGIGHYWKDEGFRLNMI